MIINLNNHPFTRKEKEARDIYRVKRTCKKKKLVQK
jgi:hypothetical protein